MLIKFWGTRGSIPVPGNKTVKYGGNTPCVEIVYEKDILILDAGSGIRELGNDILKRSVNDIHILLTHYHWDHIQGIPFFKPLYLSNFNIFIYGFSTEEYSIASLLSSQMAPKNFPISIEQVNANLNYQDAYPNSKINIKNFLVEIFQANHSSPTLIYKVRLGEKSVVYMTDNELNFEPSAKSITYNSLVNFCTGSDYLIHDAMYDETLEKSSRGWGHSSNISLALFAIEAKVKNIILFHYNPDHDDTKIDALLTETEKFLKNNKSTVNCIAAKEGLEISL